MPPSGSALKKQPARAAPVAITAAQAARQADALSDFQQRRFQRRLDELERTNPTDIPASSFVPSDAGPSRLPLGGIAPASGGVGALGGIGGDGKGKKKQAANVRKILLAKKTLRDWLEELPSDPIPPYVLAVAPPPVTPSRARGAQSGAAAWIVCGLMSETVDAALEDDAVIDHLQS